jgi:hypothetical protein
MIMYHHYLPPFLPLASMGKINIKSSAVSGDGGGDDDLSSSPESHRPSPSSVSPESKRAIHAMEKISCPFRAAAVPPGLIFCFSDPLCPT